MWYLKNPSKIHTIISSILNTRNWYTNRISNLLRVTQLIMIWTEGLWNMNVTFFFHFYVFIWSTVELQCCVNYCCTAKWLSYTFIFIFSIMIYHKILNIVPVLYSYFVVYPFYICLFNLLIPNSQSTPLPLPSLALISLFPACISVS